MTYCGPTKYVPPPEWTQGPTEDDDQEDALRYAVDAGEWENDVGKEKVYVGRACFDGQPIPGTVVPSRGCYVSYDGEANFFEDYQILVNHDGFKLRWEWTAGNKLPSGVLQGGSTHTEDPFFIGRHTHQGSMYVGRVEPTSGILYIFYDGEEHLVEKYEILVCEELRL